MTGLLQIAEGWRLARTNLGKPLGGPMTESIRDRIQDFRRVPARELLDNHGNPRCHPQAQRDALRGVLEQVGIAAALVAYHSERNGGKLTLIDGHLRKQDYDLDWPTLILDVSDAEADLLLATHDPLVALAEYDRPKLQALLQEVRAKSPAVVAMLKDLAQKTDAGKAGQGTDKPPQLPPERFEILVECQDEGHQREVYDRLTAEGMKCRVLTF
jgi:hypothetical protein